MSEKRPAYDKMRPLVETLATGPDPIRARVLAATRHFPERSEAGIRPHEDWPGLAE